MKELTKFISFLILSCNNNYKTNIENLGFIKKKDGSITRKSKFIILMNVNENTFFIMKAFDYECMQMTFLAPLL